jgi:hypothetical protein
LIQILLILQLHLTLGCEELTGHHYFYDYFFLVALVLVQHALKFEKFFEILDDMPKQEPKRNNRLTPAPAPGNSRQDIEPQNSKSTIAPNKSILDFVLPDSQKSCSADYFFLVALVLVQHALKFVTPFRVLSLNE